MFENLFTPSPLIWGGLIAGLIALPIIIHLINMMRHRKVKWAAMEFLLKSYKKHRNWVWLKQLLLLLSRIAALLLALFMLAQIGCNNNELSNLIGGKTTHHYVLIDDSFSMEDRVGDSTVFERARSTLALIAARAKDRGQQRFTVIRFSRTTHLGNDGDAGDESSMENFADMNGVIVDSSFDDEVENLRSKLDISALSVGPEKPLAVVDQLISSRLDENAHVYVLSDFRANDWQQSPEVAEQLKRIHQAGSKIELINCVEQQRSNLAITGIRPVGNVRSVNTPLLMEVSIRNYGEALMSNIQVKIQSSTFPLTTGMNDEPSDLKVAPEDLPTVFIKSIKPGETETRTFPISFQDVGQHVVTATLEDKSVNADNRAFCVCDIQQDSNVLIIDGHPDRIYANVLSVNLSPAGQRTGIRPDIQTKSFLRDATLEILDQYDVIMLCDIDRLGETELRNLESFITRGGGVSFFMGAHVDIKFYQDMLYRNGEGPLPIPLARRMEIPELIDENIADIVPLRHSITQGFVGLKNPILDAVEIYEIVRPPELWLPSEDGVVEIAATIRGNKRWPLIATRSFGKGRVCIVTTSLGAPWNNWISNPAYPIFPLRIQNWLAAGKYPSLESNVGDEIVFERSKEKNMLDVQAVSPGADSDSRVVTDIKSTMLDEDLWQVKVGRQLTAEGMGITHRAGVYEIWSNTIDGKKEVKRYALNVDHKDSDLAVVQNQHLSQQFESSNPSVLDWAGFNPEIGRNQTTMLSKIFLLVLIVLLLGEQALAYLLSYHPGKASRNARLQTTR